MQTMFHSIFVGFINFFHSHFISHCVVLEVCLLFFVCVCIFFVSLPFGIFDQIHLLRFNSTLEAIIRRIFFFNNMTDVPSFIHAHIFADNQKKWIEISRIITFTVIIYVLFLFWCKTVQIIQRRKKIQVV